MIWLTLRCWLLSLWKFNQIIARRVQKCDVIYCGCVVKLWFLDTACTLAIIPVHHTCIRSDRWIISGDPIIQHRRDWNLCGTSETLCKIVYFLSIKWFGDVSCAAMCCLIVCHGGSLHVPERLIWAGSWHRSWVGGWHGHDGPNSGLSKTLHFNLD